MSLTQSLATVSIACIAFLVQPASASMMSAQSSDPDGYFFNALMSDAKIRGALTLDNVYHFDYATAGLGSVIFHSRTKAYASWNVLESSSNFMAQQQTGFQVYDAPVAAVNMFGGSQFARGTGFGGGLTLPGEDDTSDPNIIPPIPEPSTWAAGALALLFILCSQRRRLGFPRGFSAV